MITAAIWTYLLASTACVSAAPPRDVNSVYGAISARVDSSQPAGRPRSMNNAFQPRQAGNSSVLLPIDVYMQVLSTDGTEQGGDISDATIDAQMQVLDDAFRPVGFKFNLKETIRTVNEQWYYNLLAGSSFEDEVSLALRKGGNATLNVYTMGGLNTTSQAWATMPPSLDGRQAYDGVFINGTIFLDGSDPAFNKGIGLVHEVGHWFGLYHTFSYGCEFSFDYVDDTPAEAQSVLGGCEIGKDTCPDQPGLDLIHNYMSYSDDDCRNSWTPGQIQRMREQVAKWRGVVYPGIDVNNIPEDSL